IAHRGRVNYTRVSSSSAQVLATLVPPFSPLESVGAPPERASLPVSHTDIPLAISNKTGQGGSLYFPFSLSALINEYKLGEHYQLLKNAIDMTLGQGRFIEVTPIQGLQVTLFENNNKLLIHLVNGVGRRPLAHSVPLLDLEVKLGVSDSPAKEVKSLISGQTLRCISDQERLTITLPRLDVWECIMVELE
ncbi:hypothetical protein K0U00_22940, partial [Paenibacillus sepulcri]|nr:hypothetical protein [Paenibacillus sepulcri]